MKNFTLRIKVEIRTCKSRGMHGSHRHQEDEEGIQLEIDEETLPGRYLAPPRSSSTLPKPSKMAHCCCLILSLSWVVALILVISVAVRYDAYSHNEIDFWYVARMCRRFAGTSSNPSYAEYDHTLNTVMASTCAGGNLRCQGPSCSRNGWNKQLRNAKECDTFCSGTLRRPKCLINAEYPRCVDADSLGGPATSQHLFWCPDEEVYTRDGGRLSFIACDGACAQANFVGAAPFECTSLACSTLGTEASSQTIVVDKVTADGFNVNFYMGARYRLIMFTEAAYTSALIHLTSSSGRTLVNTSVSSKDCSTRARARRTLSAGSWLKGFSGPDNIERARDGDASRWAGSLPSQDSDGNFCAASVVASGTRVRLASTCSGTTSNYALLKTPALRVETGDSFVVNEDDFPLHITLVSANASLRGDSPPTPNASLISSTATASLFFSFYTEQVDWASRRAIWYGLPLGFFFGSCCLCICLVCAVCRGIEREVQRRDQKIAEWTRPRPPGSMRSFDSREFGHLSEKVTSTDASLVWTKAHGTVSGYDSDASGISVMEVNEKVTEQDADLTT